MLKTLKILGIFALIYLGHIAILGFWGILFRPDLTDVPFLHDPGAESEAAALREVRLDPESQPRLVQSVDYTIGPRAPWWPKNEAPALRELVQAGLLDPVEERVGRQPLVLEGVDGNGRYGGTWMRAAISSVDAFISLTYLGSGGSLLRWSPHGYPLRPNVARDWASNEDETEWTFYLREGARWSDGHPFTADDFVYAYEVLHPFLLTSPEEEEKDVRMPVLEHRGKYGRVEKVDAYTVRFIFEDPYPLFPEEMTVPVAWSWIYAPRHYLEPFVPEYGEPVAAKPQLEKLLAEGDYPDARSLVQALIAPGNPVYPAMTPWIYTQHQTNPPLSFVRNPYYFGVDTEGNQLPYLDDLLFLIQQEQQIATTAANGGLTMQFRHIRFSDYTLLMNSRERNSVKFDVYHWYPGERSVWTLFPNLNRRPSPTDPQSPQKILLLNDKRFRQALSLAINRQRIIDGVYSGIGIPSQLEPGPESPYFSTGLRNAYTVFDPQRAREMLDALGLDQRDSEGYRTFPDGSSMTWFINYTAFTGPGPVEMIIDDWKRVGIRVMGRERARSLFELENNNGWSDFVVWSGAGEIQPMVEPRSFLPTANHSMQFRHWGNWFTQGGYHGRDLAGESNNLYGPPPGHPARRAMDLLDQALVETEAEERIRIFHEIFKINAEEVWTITIATPPPILVVVDKQLRNVPRMAVQTYIFRSPANTGPETYFFATGTFANGVPRTNEAKIARIQEQVLKPVPNPSLVPRGGSASPGDSLGRLLRWLFAGIFVLVILTVGLRHPYIGRRLIIMVPTMAIITVVVFSIIQIPPGNFIETRIAELEAQGSDNARETLTSLREIYWLDEPGWVRYLRWLGLPWFLSFEESDKGLLQGHLGRSMESDQMVNSIVGDRILLTVAISAGTILLTWMLALPIGIYSAVRQYSIGDYTFTALGFLGMCIPNFLLALLLGYFGKVAFGIDMTGLFSPQYAAQANWNLAKFVDLLKHIWVPIVVIGIAGTAGMIRVMRGNLLDELKKPYVTTARAKGVRPMKLLLKYPVRLALNPFISTIGGIFPTLVSGGAVVAIVLSLPTVGPLLLNSLLTEDMYMAGSMLIVLSLLGIIGTLVSDLLLLWLDPRIRMEGGQR